LQLAKQGANLHYLNQIILYRKFSANNIFTGHEILDDNYALITTEEGVIIDRIPLKDAGGDVQILNGLLTTGFINAHCHIELSHLKDVITPGRGLVQFVQQIMSKRFLFENEKLTAMQNAEQEMYNAGIVAVGDICNTVDALEIKKTSKLSWHNFIEVSGFVDAAAHQRLNEAKKIAAIYIDNEQATSLSPHAPYSVSKTLFGALNTATTNQLITIHNQECAAEDELYQHKTGDFLNLYKNFGIDISSFQPTKKSSFQSWLPYFNNNQSIISVHNSFTSKADIDFVTDQFNTITTTKKQQLFFCLCVNANKYIEKKIPPINLLRENNCTLIIGTDSYASNTQLNIFEEIKTIQQETHFTIPLVEILQWATINGARALQMDDTLGSFDKGKKPGIVLIEGLHGFNTTPGSTAKRIL